MDRLASVALISLALLAPLSCAYEPRGTPVAYKNEMTVELTVTSDEFFLVTLLAGRSKSITTREDLLPDRIRAYNSRGDLVFDRTFTWEELKESKFVVVIR